MAERNRIKQRIIRVEVMFHSLPKLLGSREMEDGMSYTRFCVAAVKTYVGVEMAVH
jgi:hypothetical protein